MCKVDVMSNVPVKEVVVTDDPQIPAGTCEILKTVIQSWLDPWEMDDLHSRVHDLRIFLTGYTCGTCG